MNKSTGIRIANAVGFGAIVVGGSYAIVKGLEAGACEGALAIAGTVAATTVYEASMQAWIEAEEQKEAAALFAASLL